MKGKYCIMGLALVLTTQISTAKSDSQTREFHLDNYDAAEIAPAIGMLFERTHPLVEIELNKESNSMVVTGPIDDVKEVVGLVKRTDVEAPRNVMIEAIISETDHSGLPLVSRKFDQHFNEKGRTPITPGDKILSTPVVVFTNGHQGEMRVGHQGEMRVGVGRSFSLSLTPFILDSRMILTGDVTISSDPKQIVVKNGNGENVFIESKRFVFSVELENKETFVIGPIPTESNKVLMLALQPFLMQL